jgi:hypothetical protein
LEPYVIRRRDTVRKVAYKLGFDADPVWNDPSNDDLRALRPNPDLLLAGDVLYVPDAADRPQPPVNPVAAGTTTTFVAPDPPTVTVSHQFFGLDSSTYDSKTFTVQELDNLGELQTTKDGLATFQVPVTLDTATIVFSDTGESWALQVGDLDPINTVSGIFQRLQNLGYISSDFVFDLLEMSNNVSPVRAGLRALKAKQNADPTAPVATAASGDPPAPSPVDQGSAPTADSDDDDSTVVVNDTIATPYDYQYDSGDGTAASDDDDDEGVADDGTVAPDTSSLVLKAYNF